MTRIIPRKITVTKDLLACIGLFFFMTQNVVNTAMLYLLHTPVLINNWVAIVLAYLPLLAIPFVDGTRRKIWDFLLLLVAVIFVCAITYACHPEYYQWMFEGEFKISKAIFRPDMALYIYLFIRLVPDTKKLYYTLIVTAFVLFAYNLYKFYYAEFVRGYWVSTGINREAKGEYNLQFGYDMLFLLSVFFELGKRHKRICYLFAACSLVLILIAGSRGPLVGVAIMLVIWVLEFIWSRPIKQRIILLGGAVLFGAVFLLNMNAIFTTLGTMLQNMGINSRTVMKLASGNIIDDNGRTRLYEISMDLIRTGGAFGHGIYGDRYVIADITSIWVGYCHNIALEILIDFGYLLGGVILLIMVVRIIRILLAPVSQLRSMYLMFLVASTQLLLSGSFWFVYTFWACCALDLCWIEAYGKGKLLTKLKKIGILNDPNPGASEQER